MSHEEEEEEDHNLGKYQDFNSSNWDFGEQQEHYTSDSQNDAIMIFTDCITC